MEPSWCQEPSSGTSTGRLHLQLSSLTQLSNSAPRASCTTVKSVSPNGPLTSLIWHIRTLPSLPNSRCSLAINPLTPCLVPISKLVQLRAGCMAINSLPSSTVLSSLQACSIPLCQAFRKSMVLTLSLISMVPAPTCMDSHPLPPTKTLLSMALPIFNSGQG